MISARSPNELPVPRVAIFFMFSSACGTSVQNYHLHINLVKVSFTCFTIAWCQIQFEEGIEEGVPGSEVILELSVDVEVVLLGMNTSTWPAITM